VAKFDNIQPLVGSALQSAIIEIEAVDVDVRFHGLFKKAEAVTAFAVTASHPTFEKMGGRYN